MAYVVGRLRLGAVAPHSLGLADPAFADAIDVREDLRAQVVEVRVLDLGSLPRAGPRSGCSVVGVGLALECRENVPHAHWLRLARLAPTAGHWRWVPEALDHGLQLRCPLDQDPDRRRVLRLRRLEKDSFLSDLGPLKVQQIADSLSRLLRLGKKELASYLLIFFGNSILDFCEFNLSSF